MPPRSSAERGFTLIEAIIVIAIMAILAGAAVPFAIKALNQAREGRTRENLKIAYEAMFGARDRRVSNMRADFGFTPAGNLPALGKMTTAAAAPAPPPLAYGLNGAIYSWGWNGPYWTGPTKLVAGTQVPVDAWGGVIQLRLIAGQRFQVISGGANGVINTPAGQIQPQLDDLVYPSQPAPLATAYGSSPTITLRNNRAVAVTGTITFRYRNGNALAGPLNVNLLPAIAAGGVVTFNSGTAIAIPPCPAGPVQVVITISTLPAITFSEVVDLLPGENHAFSYVIN